MKLITSTTNTHTRVDMATNRGLQIMKLLWLLIGVSVYGSIPAFAETYYFHNDHLGTPQALTSDSQQIVWRGDYQPFGDVEESVNTVTQNLRFPGQYFDQETRLHYNLFRDYDTDLGRYIESDPIGLVGGLSTYSYALGNPVLYSDPTGQAVPAVLFACLASQACQVALLATTIYIAGNTTQPPIEIEQWSVTSGTVEAPYCSIESDEAENERICDEQYDTNVRMCKMDAQIRGYDAKRYSDCMKEADRLYLRCIQEGPSPFW